MAAGDTLPKVEWDAISRTLTIDGTAISVGVLKAIADPNKRLLWQFRQCGKKVEAVPYTEDVVIWMDKE